MNTIFVKSPLIPHKVAKVEKYKKIIKL